MDSFPKVLLMIFFIIISGSGMILAAAPISSDQESLAQNIEGQLICTCGCTMIVDVCECGTAAQIRADIREKLAGGLTGEEVLASYVESYGETVLAAPTKKGFNLVAWITPFILLFAGVITVYVLVQRWSGHSGKDFWSVEAGPEVTDQDLQDYSDLVEKERKKYL